MQGLNNCLASYLDRVSGLETENQRLETKIWEQLEKKGPQVKDWGYVKTIEDLVTQTFANSVDNAQIVLEIDNAHLTADDFRGKYETELATRPSVESHIHGLSKVTDDTNVTQLQLKTDLGSQGGAAVHEEESQGGNKRFRSPEIEERTIVIAMQSDKVRDAEMMLMELRGTVQCLEINLDSMRNLKTSLEKSPREMEAHYAIQMEQLNGALLHLKSELARTLAEGRYQA
ncbi:hypothetical protein P7K49_008346 [Saguinus oedipus]|uniref:IF rod domain-containing protein n=1 Tax=Saguinus oedipus TaxID=9490 RepID=A0ABQ9VXH0_SAGOE|nr:hypothetical protein P7K49_008346 [Saguinus oedipus]